MIANGDAHIEVSRLLSAGESKIEIKHVDYDFKRYTW